MNKPALIAIGWAVLTAVLTTLFKPQTPEQYARIAVKHPRLADFWRLVGALGLDPVKAVMVIRELVTPYDKNDQDPPAQTPLLVDERRTATTLPVPREPSPMPQRPYRELPPVPPATRPTLRSPPTTLWGLSYVFVLAACSPVTPAQKATAADATYAADQQRCVQDSATLAESKACRARVREQWHVDGGAQ